MPFKYLRLNEACTMESLKKSEANLKAIIENSLESIWSIDTNYRIQYANEVFLKAFEQSFGVRLAPGVNLLEALPESIREFWKERYDRVFNKEHFVFSDKVELPDSDIYAKVAMTPIMLEDKVIGASFYGRDISKQKNYEIQLLAAKENAEENEERYNALYNRSNDFVYIHDLEGNFIDANQATLSMFGYTEEDITSLNFLSIIEESDLPKVLNEIYSLLDKGSQKDKVEFRLKKKNGELVYVETMSSIIFQDEKPVAIQGIARDISERKKAEESLKKLNVAIDQSKEIVFVTDKEGIISFLNPEFSKVYGFSAEEVRGKVTPRILKSGLSSPDEIEYLWKKLLNKESIKGEYKNKCKDGTLIDIEGSADPILNENGELIGFLGIHRDITDRKRVEEDLILAKEKAEEGDRLKSAFLTNMSHEIRTPMNGILGFLSLLDNTDLTNDTRTKYISILNSSGERLLNTINDIIEISKIESGDVDIANSEINIQKLMTFYYDFFQLEAQAKNVQFKLILPDEHKLIRVHTDKNKLDSVIINLIKNAIKCTDKGKIEFGYKVVGDDIKFFVKDTGMGINPESIDAVFDRFIQSDISRTKAHEGSGIGLSICKAYVELMGGSIHVESEENKGSYFYFTIPIYSEEAQKIAIHGDILETGSPGTVISQDKKLKILVTEDDDVSSVYLKTILAKIDCEIMECNNGQKALELCKDFPDIDLILMDIQMPIMNGYEATRKIREFNNNVYIIAQTAYALGGDREKALEAGCNEYIPKPINKTHLLNLIGKYTTNNR